MIKTYRIIYFALLAGLLTQAIALEVLTSANGPMQEGFGIQFSATAAYAINYLLLVLTLIGAFFGIRRKDFNPVVRMCLIMIPAILNLLYYFVNYDVNVLWCLPVLCVAYLFVWPKD